MDQIELYTFPIGSNYPLIWALRTFDGFRQPCRGNSYREGKG